MAAAVRSGVSLTTDYEVNKRDVSWNFAITFLRVKPKAAEVSEHELSSDHASHLQEVGGAA